jgi:hypothetical protein
MSCTGQRATGTLCNRGTFSQKKSILPPSKPVREHICALSLALKIQATGEEDLCICYRGSVDGGVICMLVHDQLHISRRELLLCVSRVLPWTGLPK